MHEFHARPLPSFSPDCLPPVQPKEPTHPVPFKISTGSSTYQQKLQEKVTVLNVEFSAYSLNSIVIIKVTFYSFVSCYSFECIFSGKKKLKLKKLIESLKQSQPMLSIKFLLNR